MTKIELREKYKRRRSELSNSEQEIISRKVVDLLISNFEVTDKNISCFVPITRFREINTWLILDGVNAHFYLPKMEAGNRLSHFLYEGKHLLKQNSWGVLEPINGKQILPSAIDIVLVPMLAVNRDGYRVGYGKGYYDQFLKQCNPDTLFIGLYQFDEFEIIEDIHEADVPLHYCITPNGIHSFKGI